MLYCGLLVVLLGAVASAEERQLGTLPTQLLQPVAAWQQWAIKVATALTLAVVLGIALPLVVNLVIADEGASTRFAFGYTRRFITPFLVLGAFALYVSSLCSSGIRAAITTIPVIVFAAVYSMAANDLFMRTAHNAYRATRADMVRLGAAGAASFRQMETATEAGLMAGVLLLVAALGVFAFSNHRHIDRSGRWLAAQGVIVLALITLTVAFPAVVWAVWMRLVVRAGT
jgi:energy-converting hydrogenase Eha subunit A